MHLRIRRLMWMPKALQPIDDIDYMYQEKKEEDSLTMKISWMEYKNSTAPIKIANKD